MTLTLQTFLIVCPLVFLASFVDSIAGGGGLISLPAYLIAGVPPHHAIASNKLSSCIGTAISTGRFVKNRLVDMRLGIPAVLLALVGSTIGARLLLLVDERYIKYILVIILPIVAFLVLKRKNFDEDGDGKISKSKQAIIVFIASFVIGTYDGFYGPGTGTFLLIIYVQFAKMNLRIAAGNMKLVNLASNFGSLIVFLLHGEVLLTLGLVASIFSILGHYIGSGLVMKNGSRIVRPIIMVVLTLLFVKILFL
ncbi:MAG TPA: TSUP family transporter [Lachnospiraceae bacterium]|nr:TSUP family transporter [Lachnospiraceae bacterium]